MKSRELLLRLREVLTAELRDYPFPDPSGGMRDARVFLHGLPE